VYCASVIITTLSHHTAAVGICSDKALCLTNVPSIVLVCTAGAVIMHCSGADQPEQFLVTPQAAQGELFR